MTATQRSLVLYAGLGLVAYLLLKKVGSVLPEIAPNAGALSTDDADKCVEAMRNCNYVSAMYYCPWTFGGAYFNFLKNGCTANQTLLSSPSSIGASQSPPSSENPTGPYVGENNTPIGLPL